MQKFFFKTYMLILFACLLFPGCGRKYDRTVKVCGDSLYVEVYDMNLVGTSLDYLTDTINFRLFVGKYDNEHENFNYRCEGDTLSIRKIQRALEIGGKKTVTSIRKYSITQLKKNNVFE